MLRRLQKPIILVLLILSWAWAVWAFWPAPVKQASLEFAADPLHNTLRRVTLVYPSRLRPGEAAPIRLEINGGESQTGEQGQDHQMAEARLILPGGSVLPAEVIRQPMLPGEGLQFAWTVFGPENGGLEGTAWLYVETIPAAGGVVNRRAISAQPVTIHSARQPVLPLNAARVVSGILAISVGAIALFRLRE